MGSISFLLTLFSCPVLTGVVWWKHPLLACQLRSAPSWVLGRSLAPEVPSQYLWEG